jgi:hypothetical protein
MKDRQAQGKSRSGRYKADDTARLKFIHCSARPLLYKGKLPLDHDMRMLELGPIEDLSGRDKIDVEQWVRIHHTDPRSKHKLQTLDVLQQTSILTSWVRKK